MAVGVEDRHEHEIDMVEQSRAAAHGDVAQQHEAGVLAVDLAGVDAGLGEQHRPADAAAAAGDHRIEGATLGAAAESLDPQQGRGGDEPIDKSAGLVIARRGIEAARLGRRDPGMAGRRDQPLAGAVPGGRGRERRLDRGRLGESGAGRPGEEQQQSG